MFFWKDRLILHCEIPWLHEICTLLMNCEHNSKLSRISSKSGIPLLCIRLRCRNREKLNSIFFQAQSETSLWSGKCVGGGNMFVLKTDGWMLILRSQWKAPFCHSREPCRVARKFFIYRNLNTGMKVFEILAQQKLNCLKEMLEQS